MWKHVNIKKNEMGGYTWNPANDVQFGDKWIAVSAYVSHEIIQPTLDF